MIISDRTESSARGCVRRGLLALLAVAVGCATPLGATHTATVVPFGHVEFAVQAAQNYPVGAYQRINPQAQATAKELVRSIAAHRTVTLDPSRDVYVAIGAALSLAELPSQQNEVLIRAGILPRVDLGLRYTGAVWRGELFGQIFDGQPLQLVAGVGAAWRGFREGLPGVLHQFGLLQFAQLDVDATLLAGHQWTYGALYFGPRLVFSKYWATGTLTGNKELHVNVLGAQIDSNFSLGLDPSQSWLIGGVLGGRIGYRFVWLVLEAAVYDALYEPTLFGVRARLGGIVLYPTVGLAATF